MAVYRDDEDLAFLQYCDNDDLSLLVSILTHDPKDNAPRYTETLTKHEDYLLHNPKGDHQKYWQAIAAEVQTFGANSLVTVIRGGRGVLYREILIDVCNKQKVIFKKDVGVEFIENALLNKILVTSFENMSSSDLASLAAELGVTNARMMPSMLAMMFQKSMMDNPILWSNTIYSILRYFGYNLGKMIAPKTLPLIGILTGPIGWAISGMWMSSDIAGPAFRVTLPVCLYISSLRKKS